MQNTIKKIIIERLTKNGVITTFFGCIFLAVAIYLFVGSEDYYKPAVSASIGAFLLGIKDNFFSNMIKK